MWVTSCFLCPNFLDVRQTSQKWSITFFFLWSVQQDDQLNLVFFCSIKYSSSWTDWTLGRWSILVIPVDTFAKDNVLHSQLAELLCCCPSDLLCFHLCSVPLSRPIDDHEKMKCHVQTYVGVAVKDEARCAAAVGEEFKLVGVWLTLRALRGSNSSMGFLDQSRAEHYRALRQIY